MLDCHARGACGELGLRQRIDLRPAESVGVPRIRVGGEIDPVRVGADVRLVGQYRSPFTLAAGASLYVPTGNQNDYTSDGVVRAVVPHLNFAGELGAFASRRFLAMYCS